MNARPIFERLPTAERSRQRLLLISYHFPPDATIGARRWAKLAPFVAERGWGLDVITRIENGTDLSALEHLPADVRVYGIPPVVLLAERIEHVAWRVYRSLRPARGRWAAAEQADGGLAADDVLEAERTGNGRRSVLRSVRTPRDVMRAYWAWLQFANPGAWTQHAVALADAIIEPGVHFAVITSGPPHMTHDGGRLISTKHHLPFVMDMRDPWSLTQRHAESMISPLWLRLAERYERRAIEQAALVVANTEQARDALGVAYPEARDRIIVVMNGSDDDPIPPSRFGERFTIGYAGTVYLNRDPRSLFQGAAQVIRELALTPRQFGIELIGGFGSAEEEILRDLARQAGLSEYVSVGPARSHAAAIEFLASAPMLVTFPGWNTITIPAKLFEYVRFDAWILALSERDSATDVLLRGTDADVVPPDDIAGIAAAIRRRYEAYIRGVRPARVVRDDRLSRRAQSRILLDALARLLSREEPPRARSVFATRS